MRLLVTILITINFQLSQGISYENIYSNRFQNDSIILIDSAMLLVDAEECIHALAINSEGQLFVAGCQDVYKITEEKKLEHFLTLTDITDKTMIWGMVFDKRGDLILAAKDRIVKITPDGKQTSLIKEDFGGPSGVSDVRLDKAGNLYIVYNNIVAKYDDTLQKSIFIDGAKLDPPVKWSVGIEFDKNEEHLYIGDCNGKNLYIIPIGEQTSQKEIRVIPTNWGQYLTKDNNGNIFLTMFGSEKSPEFLMIHNNKTKYYIHCKKRPFQNREIHKKAIVFNSSRNSNNGIYCIIGSKVYLYPINDNIGK